MGPRMDDIRGLYNLGVLCYTMHMAQVAHIWLPTRPQPDTIVAIFLLKKFGGEMFGNIMDATITIRPSLPEGETFETLLAAGTLALDLGGGPLDHHNKKQCTSELVAQYLGITRDPSIAQLLAYAKRDDKQGKGTLSRDQLDRAFGLSGLIAALNKAYPGEPMYVATATLPLLEAHWRSANEHYVELPRDVAHKKQNGEYAEHVVAQGARTLKLVAVISDKPAMPTYLRSAHGGRADIVLQKAQDTNHLCVLTRQDRGINLEKIAALMRLREAELAGIELPESEDYISQVGRIDEVPHWYFDPATNSLLNGGIHSKDVPPSGIAWDEAVAIVRAGLELGSDEPMAPEQTSTYYLSINLPEDVARRITSRIEAPQEVKVHHPKNLHITLHHFGQLARTKADHIAQSLVGALSGAPQFELTLHDGQLTAGSPEGYTDTHAWYLAVEPDATQRIHAMRASALAALGIAPNDKMLHITLAANRNRNASIPGSGVRFSEPVEMTVPITEVVLMESALVGGKREYRVHSTYPLQS